MKKAAEWNPMRFPLLPFTLLMLATVLGACSSRPQTQQSTADQLQSTSISQASASGTGSDSPNEQTPKTTDSLEVAPSATGAVMETTITASGTILTGDPANPHRLIVFIDYDCPYCRRFIIGDLQWIENDLVRTNQLTIERVFVPLTTDGTVAARLALCAARQGKFAEADAWLATHSLSDSLLQKQLVKVLNLKTTQLQRCIATKNLLSDHEKLAAELNVQRVPFFVLGKSSWLGLLPREELRRTIERELTR